MKSHESCSDTRERIPGPVLLALSVLLLLLAAGPAFARDLPFGPGERLSYTIRWLRIPVGEAVLSVGEAPDRPGLTFFFTARSFRLFDPFHRVRTTAFSIVDHELTRSLHYFKDQHEGGLHRAVEIDFDWSSGLAMVLTEGEPVRTMGLDEPLFDPLGLLYAFRSEMVHQGWERSFPVTDGMHMASSRSAVQWRGRVRVEAGEFDTFLIEQELPGIESIFLREEGAPILVWITADRRQVPVKLQTRTALGTISVELSSIDFGK
jgi:hypothetical protein